MPFTPAENKQINFYVADSYSTTTLYLYSINIQMNNKQATMDYKETISLSDASIDIVNFNYVIDANFKISNPEAKNVHIDLTCNGLSTSEGEIYTEETDSLNIALARTITGYHLYIFSNLNMAKENISTVSVRLTIEEKTELIQYCEDNDLTMSQVIRKAIKEYLSGQDMDKTRM